MDWKTQNVNEISDFVFHHLTIFTFLIYVSAELTSHALWLCQARWKVWVMTTVFFFLIQLELFAWRLSRFLIGEADDLIFGFAVGTLTSFIPDWFKLFPFFCWVASVFDAETLWTPRHWPKGLIWLYAILTPVRECVMCFMWNHFIFEFFYAIVDLFLDLHLWTLTAKRFSAHLQVKSNHFFPLSNVKS